MTAKTSMFLLFLHMVLASTLFLAAGTPAQAQSLPAPSGTPILTVEGKITNTNVGDTAQFDRSMLEALGIVSFTTSTPWYPEPSEFEGVPLKKLMDAVGAKGTEMEAVALNDYQATLPISDFETFGTILALKRNGKDLPVKDKGPLFIVYPYDSDPRLQTQGYYARSVWHLAKLIVK